MKKIRDFFSLFIIIIIIIILFRYNFILDDTIRNAYDIWLKKLFPSLFIMLIINDIIINTGALNIIKKYTNYIFNKLFKTSNNSSLAFALSLFSGTPSQAFILTEMLKNNDIDVNDANKLITFTFFSNPLFLLKMLTTIFNYHITIKIIISHYLANIFIGLFFFNNKNTSQVMSNNKINKSLINIIPNAISKSINTMLMILGNIVFYLIITNYISYIFNIKGMLLVIIRGIFEITQGLNGVSLLNISIYLKSLLVIAIINFGGLSIHTQILCIIKEYKILYSKFFLARLLHIVLGMIIFTILFNC